MFEDLRLEILLGEVSHFAANIEFLRQHNLGKLIGHLVQADRRLRLKENNDMIITQEQLDTLTQTDPNSGTADHTVTEMGEDGTTTTEPVDTTEPADASTGGTGAGDTAPGDAAATS